MTNLLLIVLGGLMVYTGITGQFRDWVSRVTGTEFASGNPHTGPYEPVKEQPKVSPGRSKGK